ncbi:MAG: hypothetical protein JO303_12310 [Caulobacteraceae bacterium]|nr:hypothetical protein [Caulobacteraceae bacterium]
MSKRPPIAAEQRSRPAAGAPSDKRPRPDQAGPPSRDIDVKHQGRAGDRYQNTHHQGYQQDR